MFCLSNVLKILSLMYHNLSFPIYDIKKKKIALNIYIGVRILGGNVKKPRENNPLKFPLWHPYRTYLLISYRLKTEKQKSQNINKKCRMLWLSSISSGTNDFWGQHPPKINYAKRSLIKIIKDIWYFFKSGW